MNVFYNTLGALKPKIDKRDYIVKSSAASFPETYQCEDITPVKNQKSVSSCVAHATATILEVFNKIETGEYKKLSTNFIYGMQGVKFNRKDKGMYLRDACKIIKEYGDPYAATIKGNTEQPKCTEELRTQLDDAVYAEAAKQKIKSYAKCNTEEDIKHALMNYGPVLISVNWYNKSSIKNNIIQMNKKQKYGRHAIVIYGWNKDGWLCQNSWGVSWNKTGRFIYPFSEKINEAWSFVDAENTDIIKPARGKWFDIFYKIFNFILNLFNN